MRRTIVVGFVLATFAASTAVHAETDAGRRHAIISWPDDHEPAFDELAVVTGVLFGGAFIEQRNCRIKRDRYVGCMHLLYGKQEGGTMKGNIVFDLYSTAGVVLRRGRFDLTPAAGGSMLSTTMFIGLLLASPFTQELPDPRLVYTAVPFEITGNVALGYTFARKGRFRSRAELAVRAHVPLFTDSTLELPSPHGLAATFGVGAGF